MSADKVNVKQALPTLPAGIIVEAKTKQAPLIAAPVATPTPTLGTHWASLYGGNLTKALQGSGIALVNSVKNENRNAFEQTDKAPTEQTLHTSINLGKSITNIMDKLNAEGVDPKDAQTVIRGIFNDPKAREGVLGKDSMFNDPAYINGLSKQPAGVGGSKNYDDDAVEKIADLYSKAKKNYDSRYSIAPGTKIPATAVGEQGLQEIKQELGKKAKLRITTNK